MFARPKENMLIILTRKRSLTYDLLRKALRMPKLRLGVSLKSYCQSPVSSSLATLKEREQEASLPEVSAHLPIELLSIVVSAVNKLKETDTVVGVVLGYIPRKLLRQLVVWKIMVAQTRVGQPTRGGRIERVNCINTVKRNYHKTKTTRFLLCIHRVLCRLETLHEFLCRMRVPYSSELSREKKPFATERKIVQGQSFEIKRLVWSNTFCFKEPSKTCGMYS